MDPKNKKILFLAAIKIFILPGQLRKFCIKTKIPFCPLLLMQSLHNCPGKLGIFMLSKVINFNFFGIKYLWKNYKIMKQFIINICFIFFSLKGKMAKKIQFWHFWIFCHFRLYWRNSKTDLWNNFFSIL